jgi:hypothetical protein
MDCPHATRPRPLRENDCQHLDLPDHRKVGRQVGQGPSSGSRLVDGPLVNPERGTDDPINSELTLGRADRKGCGTPAGRLRGLTVWQHGRMRCMAHDGRIADPLRNVQPRPARSCRDRQHTPASPKSRFSRQGSPPRRMAGASRDRGCQRSEPFRSKVGHRFRRAA